MLALVFIPHLATAAAAPVVEWSASAYAVGENAGSLAARVTRRGDLSGSSLVTFASVNGTAISGTDYNSVAGTLTFNPGESNLVVNISLLDNAAPQASRSFNLLLANFSNAVPGLQSNATVAILDDETSAVLDPWFDPALGANKDIFTLGLLADGRILVGGQFTKWNNQTGAANLIVLRPDGGTEIFFTFPNNTPDAAVYAVAALTNGFLIGGDFISVGGTARAYLARMMSFGGLETNWVPASINSSLRALAVQPDGKILIAGRFTQVSGQPRNRIARLNADGSLDTTFAPAGGANNSIRSLALQPDGRVLIGGQFTTFDGVTRSNVARLQTNGLLDLTFNPGTGADKQVRSVAVQADGKILIGGDFENYNGALRSCVARLFPNGALDPAFDTGPSTNDFVRVVAPAAGGKVWIGGSFDFRGGAARANLALVDSNGLADSFVADAGFEVDTILTQPDGQTLVAGDFGSIIGFATPRLARLNTGVLFTPAPQIQLATNQLLVAETVGLAPLTVTRRGDLTVTAQVSYATSTYGNATAGQDYVSIAGTLNFAPLEVAKIIGLPIINDSLPEPFQNFELDLTAALPPAQLGQPSFAIVTIEDDDFGFEFTADTYATSEPEGSATITVRRGGTGSDTVSVDFIVSSGTATAGLDFMATNGTLIFQPGETQKTFSVTILADALTEGIETAQLTLTNASAGTALGFRRSATLTIDDVDSTFNWYYATLPSESDGTISGRIIRTGNMHLAATVGWFVVDGTAIAGLDYIATNGTAYFPPDVDRDWATVVVLNDGLVEGDENLYFRLVNPSPGSALGPVTNAIATILDNDAGMAFTGTNLVVSENSPFVILTVLRHDDGLGSLNVEYFTSDGPALAGANYLARSGMLNFPTNSTTNIVTISLLDACGLTNDLTFRVTLRNPAVGGALGSNFIAVVTVRGNDRSGRQDLSFVPLPPIPMPFYPPGEYHLPGGPPLMSVLPSGQALFGWLYYYDQGFYHYAPTLFRAYSSGIFDDSFVAHFSTAGRLYSLAVQRDGRILVGGSYDNSTKAEPWLCRMTSSGELDPSFQQPTNFYGGSNYFNFTIDVPSVLEQPDGKILVARDVQPLIPDYMGVVPPRHPGIMRLLANGSSDPGFNPGSGAQYLDYRAGVQAMAVQPDGRILVGGLFTNFSGYPRLGLARLDTNGVIEAGFVPYGGTRQLNVSEIKLQTDGKILIVGAFSNLFGTTISQLARLFTNGLIDTSFNPMPVTGGTIQKILLQPNGRIVIGGNFTNVQGFARYGLARLNANGSLDQTFDPAPDQYNVIALALQPDGRILVSDASTGLWRVEGDPVPRVRELSRTNNVARLRLDSRPGKTYALEASTNLVNWLRLATNTAADCTLEFLDAASPPARRFYRAVQLAP